MISPFPPGYIAAMKCCVLSRKESWLTKGSCEAQIIQFHPIAHNLYLVFSLPSVVAIDLCQMFYAHHISCDI